jgi:hypothetical protein
VHLSQQTEIMPAKPLPSRTTEVVVCAIRWLRLLLIPPLGLTLFISCIWTRWQLWDHFGGKYYESADVWFPEEIPGSTSSGFGVAWALTVFGCSLLFFLGTRLLAQAAWKQTVGWLTNTNLMKSAAKSTD